MSEIILRPTFSKDLDGLRRSSRKHYQRASEILLELQRDQEPSASRRSESRIPNCVKFELLDGYRLVMQRTQAAHPWVKQLCGTADQVFWTCSRASQGFRMRCVFAGHGSRKNVEHEVGRGQFALALRELVKVRRVKGAIDPRGFETCLAYNLQQWVRLCWRVQRAAPPA